MQELRKERQPARFLPVPQPKLHWQHHIKVQELQGKRDFVHLQLVRLHRPLKGETPEMKDSVKVFVAGTFDGVHAGHLRLFEFAKRRGKALQRKLKRKTTVLHVIVGRDANVRKVKGKPALHTERERLKLVKSIRGVDKAMLGHPVDFFESVRKVAPDLVVLGHDQNHGIEEKLAEMGYSLVVRCPAYARGRLASRELKKKKFHKKT